MSKYRNSLVSVICELIEHNLTIKEVCRLMHITRKTFYQWRKEKPAFRLGVDNAYARRDFKLLHILSKDKITVSMKKVHD